MAIQPTPYDIGSIDQFYFERSFIIKIINITPDTNTKPPQSGIVTYHQDQFITLHSFRITKATPSKPKTPIPDDELEFLDIFILFKCYFEITILPCITPNKDFSLA